MSFQLDFFGEIILSETERRERKLKEIRVLMLTLIVTCTVSLAFNVSPVVATETLYISSDFTFTEDIYEPICVTADNIVIDGNGYTLQGSGDGYGITIYGRSNVTIKNVTVKGWVYGIKLQYSNYNSICGNNITDNNNQLGIWLWTSSYNTISDNYIANNGLHGIFLMWSSNNNNIFGNRIRGHVYHGIWINQSLNNTISENNLIENDELGIMLSVSSNSNSISRNNITNNKYLGIFLQLSSSYNSISGNNITRHQHEGIWFYKSSNCNSISDNYIANNGVGIGSNSSSNNVVYHNNFIDNVIQAYDESPEDNDWHHTDLLEGNYWSDYPGVDDGSGTGKHAIAGDGVGDTDIPWPGPDHDNYPFTHESGWMIITATVDIDPDTLNLKSNGAFVTAYVELPDGYNVADIVLDTVCLDSIQAITDPQYDFVTDPNAYLVDHDADGILERMVKFDRDTVRDTLTGVPDCEEGNTFYDLPLTVTGKVAGISFEGTDTIVVLRK